MHLTVTLLFAACPVQARELKVTVQAEGVSVRAQGTPLGEVLAEIARQADLQLASDEPLTADTSIAFQRLPLNAAIRRILGDRGFVLEYRRSAGGTIQPHRLWVVGGADGPSLTAGAPAPPGPAERLEALSSLADEGGRQATRALAAAALNDADRAVRREAIHALGEVAGEAGIDALERALMDADRGVRESAAAAFGEIGGERSSQALAAALHDDDPQVRQEAADALGDIGGPSAARLLSQALDDDHPAVREAAAEGLADLPDEDP